MSCRVEILEPNEPISGCAQKADGDSLRASTRAFVAPSGTRSSHRCGEWKEAVLGAVSLGPLAMPFAWTPRCVASVELPAALVDYFLPSKSQQGEPVSVPLGLAFLIGNYVLMLAFAATMMFACSSRAIRVCVV